MRRQRQSFIPPLCQRPLGHLDFICANDESQAGTLQVLERSIEDAFIPDFAGDCREPEQAEAALASGTCRCLRPGTVEAVPLQGLGRSLQARVAIQNERQPSCEGPGEVMPGTWSLRLGRSGDDSGSVILVQLFDARAKPRNANAASGGDSLHDPSVCSRRHSSRAR